MQVFDAVTYDPISQEVQYVLELQVRQRVEQARHDPPPL